MHFSLESAKHQGYFTAKKHVCDFVKQYKRHFVDFWICLSPVYVYFLIILQSIRAINNCALETTSPGSPGNYPPAQGPQPWAVGQHHADPALNPIPTATEH